MLRTHLFRIADQRGIRYSWLAERLGYSQEYLSRVKAGSVPVSAEFQRRVCALFDDIPPDLLFFTLPGERDDQMVNTKDRVPA